MDHSGRASGELAKLQRLHPDNAGWIPRGPVATTKDTVYFGFGFEGITDAADRNEVMGRAMRHLLSST